jgi:hypothetical protein
MDCTTQATDTGETRVKSEEKTLWMLTYRTTRGKITRRTVMHLEFFYAENKGEARKQADAFKQRQARPIYEESLEPRPEGFRIKNLDLDGRVRSEDNPIY